MFIPFPGQAQFRQDLGLTIAIGSAADDVLRNYFVGASFVNVINQISVDGNSIDDYLDNLANEFLRIMNIRLANQNLPLIDIAASGQEWRTSLRESLGTTETDKKANVIK